MITDPNKTLTRKAEIEQFLRDNPGSILRCNERTGTPKGRVWSVCDSLFRHLVYCSGTADRLTWRGPKSVVTFTHRTSLDRFYVLR